MRGAWLDAGWRDGQATGQPALEVSLAGVEGRDRMSAGLGEQREQGEKMDQGGEWEKGGELGQQKDWRQAGQERLGQAGQERLGQAGQERLG